MMIKNVGARITETTTLVLTHTCAANNNSYAVAEDVTNDDDNHHQQCYDIFRVSGAVILYDGNHFCPLLAGWQRQRRNR